jgi:hypothetical protein
MTIRHPRQSDSVCVLCDAHRVTVSRQFARSAAGRTVRVWSKRCRPTRRAHADSADLRPVRDRGDDAGGTTRAAPGVLSAAATPHRGGARSARADDLAEITVKCDNRNASNMGRQYHTVRRSACQKTAAVKADCRVISWCTLSASCALSID